MKSRRLILLLVLVAALATSGCVDGTVRVTVLPDGAGSIAIDLGYGIDKWPAMFGDPLAGFRTREQLAGFMEKGMIAWSEPRIVDTPTTRRWQGEVFFDDIGELQFLGRHDDRVIEAASFEPDFERGVITVRPDFLVYLEDPLPLPTPEKAGMTDVSLSPALLEAIKQRIRPVIEGLDVTLELELPGTITRAAGLDTFDGRVAELEIDANRLALAFASKARVLCDDQALREDPTWRWEVPVQWDQEAAEELRRRRGRALEWWGGE